MKAVWLEPLGNKSERFRGELVSSSQENLILQGTMKRNFFETWSIIGERRVDFSIGKDLVYRGEKR